MDDAALLRYSRHLLLPELGVEGQQRLADATALVVGLGGLGSPVALYLAAAGVGRLRLADFDRVEASNLQRQIIHHSDALGLPKTASAAARIQALNAATVVECVEVALDDDHLPGGLRNVTVVVDGSDNFATRYALNRACLAAGVPLVSGAAIGLRGQLTVFDFRDPDSACYACLYGEEADAEQDSCSSSGVLSPLVGVIGSMQAVETLKLIAGIAPTLAGRVQRYDARSGRWQQARLGRDPHCSVCGPHRP